MAYEDRNHFGSSLPGLRPLHRSAPLGAMAPTWRTATAGAWMGPARVKPVREGEPDQWRADDSEFLATMDLYRQQPDRAGLLRDIEFRDPSIGRCRVSHARLAPWLGLTHGRIEHVAEIARGKRVGTFTRGLRVVSDPFSFARFYRDIEDFWNEPIDRTLPQETPVTHCTDALVDAQGGLRRLDVMLDHIRPPRCGHAVPDAACLRALECTTELNHQFALPYANFWASQPRGFEGSTGNLVGLTQVKSFALYVYHLDCCITFSI